MKASGSKLAGAEYEGSFSKPQSGAFSSRSNSSSPKRSFPDVSVAEPARHLSSARKGSRSNLYDVANTWSASSDQMQGNMTVPADVPSLLPPIVQYSPLSRSHNKLNKALCPRCRSRSILFPIHNVYPNEIEPKVLHFPSATPKPKLVLTGCTPLPFDQTPQWGTDDVRFLQDCNLLVSNNVAMIPIRRCGRIKRTARPAATMRKSKP